MDKIKRIQALVKELNEASEQYYKHDRPIMSDKKFDALYDELQGLEQETNYIVSGSPTQKVGGKVLNCFQKVPHTEPMLSAEKSKKIEDLFKFMGDKLCILSWKLDGLTLVLRYKDGIFYQALTRGGGYDGEDVTHTILTFTNIPLTIPFKGNLELRGEGLVSFKDFERINQELLVLGQKPYESARNLASGSVRNLDSRVTKSRNLFFIAFGIIKCDKEIMTKYDQLQFLTQLGFKTVYYQIVEKSTLNSFIEHFEKRIPSLPYLTDGLIIEYNDIVYGKSLGYTEHHYKNLFALKWKDDSLETIFRGIELNTTRTGLVSIKAIYDTVKFDGAKNDRASLHNYSIFEDLQLGVGDKILVYRANSVIPQVEDNFTRSGTFKINMICPTCDSEIIIKQPNDTKFLYCSNDNCPSKLVNKFVHFCSKDGMNIEGFSKASIDLFIEKGFINTFDDIYKLVRYKWKIFGLDGWGLKSYNKLIQSVNKSKNVKMENFVYALGIPQIGKTASKTLAQHYKGDFKGFLGDFRWKYDFTNLKDFGQIMSDNIRKWYENKDEWELWHNLIDENILTFIIPKQQKIKNPNNPFNGKKVYGTGSFANYKKDELKSILEGLGAEFANGYSSKLDYLIVGSLKGSSKVDKAQKDNIKILSEEEFITMIKG